GERRGRINSPKGPHRRDKLEGRLRKAPPFFRDRATLCYTSSMNDIHDMLRDAMPGLPPPPWPLIGEGLWSSVHDLGDGTVLKLVRRQTPGLGSGVAIHRREALALAALGGLATERVSVPALAAEGAFDGGSCAGWLHIARLGG